MIHDGIGAKGGIYHGKNTKKKLLQMIGVLERAEASAGGGVAGSVPHFGFQGL